MKKNIKSGDISGPEDILPAKGETRSVAKKGIDKKNERSANTFLTRRFTSLGDDRCHQDRRP
jgi:hypothetical protein